MANISKIQISGTSYNLKDENACNVVELTQAEYDDLPTTAKTSNSLFVITDAQGADLSNYYTKSETSGATEISTALNAKADTATTYTKTETDNAITAATSTKQDTLVSGTNIKTINNQSILGEGNITIEGGSGGGKAIEAGRGISITKGETADTVSFNLPISAGTGSNSILMNEGNLASGSKSIAGGQWCEASAEGALAFGQVTHAYGNWCVSLGNNTIAGNKSYPFGKYSMAVNDTTQALGESSFACGSHNITKNINEFSCGVYNVSNTGSTDADNTLFSVGNGTSTRHNAFEIRQNGDIYISKDGQDVKLQDQLGGGGGSITIDPSLDSGSTNAVANSAITNAIYNQTARFDGNASDGYLVSLSPYEGENYIGIIGGKIKTLANSAPQSSSAIYLYTSTINGKKALSNSSSNTKDFSLVETSAITTTITSSSTDAQVPSAKAVYDMVGNINTILESI